LFFSDYNGFGKPVNLNLNFYLNLPVKNSRSYLCSRTGGLPEKRYNQIFFNIVEESGGKMIRQLKIHIYKPGKKEPETKITVPLASLQISERLLPSKVKASLANEGIDLNELAGLFDKEGPTGTLIEVENANEKLELIVE